MVSDGGESLDEKHQTPEWKIDPNKEALPCPLGPSNLVDCQTSGYLDRKKVNETTKNKKFQKYKFTKNIMESIIYPSYSTSVNGKFVKKAL